MPQLAGHKPGGPSRQRSALGRPQGPDGDQEEEEDRWSTLKVHHDEAQRAISLSHGLRDSVLLECTSKETSFIQQKLIEHRLYSGHCTRHWDDREGQMLKEKLQYFGHLMQRTDSLEKALMLEKIEGRRRRG